MDKIYKCKKCGLEVRPKEIDIDLKFQKSVRKISAQEDVTEIPIIGTHKNCGGEVIIIEN